MALTLTSFDGTASAEFKKTLYLNIDGEKYEIGEITHPNGEQLILTYINRVCMGYAEKKLAELRENDVNKPEVEQTESDTESDIQSSSSKPTFDIISSEDC
jgi:hypothetical protein